MRKIISDLIRNPGDEHVSHTRFWSNIAYAVCTIAFIWQCYQGTASNELWIIYLGTLAGHHTASKYLNRSSKITKDE